MTEPAEAYEFEVPYDVAGRRVWVAGHRGMVGSAVVRWLEREPIGDLITASSSHVDLARQTATEQFVARAQPDVAIIQRPGWVASTPTGRRRASSSTTTS